MSIPCNAIVIFSAGLMALVPDLVFCQDYPNKPIRIVTGSAGGGSDFTARLIAQGISGPLGQPVILDNRPAILATEAASKAPPDGYTLLVHGAAVWITPLLQKVSYDVEKDFSPISLIGREINILVVHPSLPVRSVKELIALAKARPGELNYSSGSVGGPAYLGVELFKSLAGVNIVNVPYKGTAPVITAVVSGEVHLTVSDLGLAAPHVKSGRLIVLAVTSAEASSLVPGLPTVASAGLSGYEFVPMTFMLAPAKTSGAIINRLNQEIVRALRGTDVKEKFFNAGVETVGSSPAQFAATIKSETSKWAKVIKDAGL